MRLISKISFAIILMAFGSLGPLKAQTTITSLDAIVRDVTELDIGFNRRSDQGTWWTDNSFINLVSEMNPDAVRYPAGTQANYWDWREGKFLDNTDKSWNNKEILKIPEFVAALPERTKAIYVVNMARPTPTTGVSVLASEAILKSQSTLNAKISDMLAAIDEFVAQGKQPYAIELGNEFFFGNIESGIFEIVELNGLYYSGWDTANNQPFESTSKQDATEINAKFYLDQCKDIVSAIKALFPDIKIAVTTTKGGNGTSARDRWNQTIFDELENNANYSALKSDTYAVTQHHYLNDSYGVQTVINDNASAKVAIAEGIQYPIDKQVDYDLVPNDYKIWYTEYGATKGIAEETWASAVRYVALVHSWISRGDKVGQLDWHYISDNNVVKTGSPMILAPVGIAAKMVAQASADMTEMQEINFNTNPISVNEVKSLYGYKFKNDQKETLLIINTNDTDFSQVQFSNLFTYSGQPQMTQYYSNAPYVSGIYDGHSNILSTISDVINNLFINKFSITVVQASNTLGISNSDHENISIYPNPVEDILNINTVDNIQSVSIMTINGVKLYNGINIKDKRIYLGSLNTGIYIIKIETNKGLETKKLIKK